MPINKRASAGATLSRAAGNHRPRLAPSALLGGGWLRSGEFGKTDSRRKGAEEGHHSAVCRGLMTGVGQKKADMAGLEGSAIDQETRPRVGMNPKKPGGQKPTGSNPLANQLPTLTWTAGR